MQLRLLGAGFLCGVFALSGCGSSDPPRADPTPRQPSSSTTTDPPVPDNGSATEELLLARQVQLQEGGDGLFPNCRLDEETPPEFERDPGVWLNSLYSSTDYPGITVLCLRGFEASEPIEVVLNSGDFRSMTTVRPVQAVPTGVSPLGYDDEVPTTLFDDQGELRVYTQSADTEDGAIEGPRGSMVSQMWQFLPPSDAREQLAASGSLTISAEQGDVRASMRLPIQVPQERAHYDVGAVDRQLAVVGYPAGARVPIGVYRQGSGPAVTLVKQVATVTMPASQVASLPLRQKLLRGVPEGDYCVMPPVSVPPGCAELTKWPAYPGQVLSGDRGIEVERWQHVLIVAEVMSDIPENRDGFYGPATARKLGEFLQARGMSNPDGGVTLGPGLYTLLTGERAD